MKTFLVDNSMNIEIVGIIMAIVSFILPVPEKITFNLSSKKKGTRSDDDKNDNESVKDRIELHVEACHYAFFKFAASLDVSGTPLENMFGIKKLDANTIQDPYDLPMLRCEVTNNSHQEIRISEPIIQGEIEIHSNSYTEMGFQMIPSADKILKPGAKAEFYIHGPVIIFIIKAFLENKITAIYAEDNSGFKYHADLTAIDSIVAYFSKYCSDLAELRDRHDKFCI